MLGLSTFRQASGRTRGLKIGVTDWNLHLTGKVEAVALASQVGFDGVQVSLGRKPVNARLPLDDEAVQQQWVADSIPITKKLNARVILLPFFGKGALTTHEEMDYVGDALREIAPEAEKAGVILGLEDTISAEDNVRIMERAKSPAVLTYYDVGNSTQGGFDVVKEIRWLGKDRICQFHLKDNPNYLGEGKIDFPPILKAIEDIGFHGFANLETDSPSHVIEQDMGKNLRYVRRLIG